MTAVAHALYWAVLWLVERFVDSWNLVLMLQDQKLVSVIDTEVQFWVPGI